MPIDRVRDVAKAVAKALRRNCVDSMAASTRALVSGFTRRVPLSTWETVLTDTPATRATSAMVPIRSPPSPSRRRYSLSRSGPESPTASQPMQVNAQGVTAPFAMNSRSRFERCTASSGWPATGLNPLTSGIVYLVALPCTGVARDLRWLGDPSHWYMTPTSSTIRQRSPNASIWRSSPRRGANARAPAYSARLERFVPGPLESRDVAADLGPRQRRRIQQYQRPCGLRRARTGHR